MVLGYNNRLYQGFPGLQYTHDTGQGLDQAGEDRQVEIVMQAVQDSHAARS
jgi:hypothetical protein